MATYPTTPREDFLQWALAHAPIFLANDSEIGLTENQAMAFQTAANAAQAAQVAQTDAKDATKTATNIASVKFSDLRKQASTVIRNIKNFAENQDNPSVYDIAQIPPPADPSEIPPPAKPTGITVELDAANGAVTLKWKAANPKGAAGTSYIVYRRLPANPQGEFAFVGVTGVKKFTDNTFVAGPDAVQYRIQGQRSDKAGPLSDIFTVSFGRNAQGQQTAFVTSGEQQAMKLAA